MALLKCGCCGLEIKEEEYKKFQGLCEDCYYGIQDQYFEEEENFEE